MSLGEAIVSWRSAGVCECWAMALAAIEDNYAAILCDGPLPIGWITAHSGPWFLTLNNWEAPSGGLGPYHISGRNDEAGARCLLAMHGGRLSNYTEDRFLADMHIASIARSFRAPAGKPSETDEEASDEPEA